MIADDAKEPQKEIRIPHEETIDDTKKIDPDTARILGFKSWRIPSQH